MKSRLFYIVHILLVLMLAVSPALADGTREPPTERDRSSDGPLIHDAYQAVPLNSAVSKSASGTSTSPLRGW